MMTQKLSLFIFLATFFCTLSAEALEIRCESKKWVKDQEVPVAGFDLKGITGNYQISYWNESGSKTKSDLVCKFVTDEANPREKRDLGELNPLMFECQDGQGQLIARSLFTVDTFYSSNEYNAAIPLVGFKLQNHEEMVVEGIVNSHGEQNCFRK